jgi:hypothetical protein
MPREIPTHIWVGALIRRATMEGAFATIAHKGDMERGDVLVRVVKGRGESTLYGPAFNPDGPTEFERVPAADDAAIDEAIAKRRRADGDLWVIEIEDRAGRHFLTEKVREG